MTHGRQNGWLQRRRVLSRRGDLLWTDPAPCVGVHRARAFLFPARPRFGRRKSKILAKNKELWPCDAVTDTTPSRDAASGGTTPSHDAWCLRRAASARRASFRVETPAAHQRNVVQTCAGSLIFRSIPRPGRPIRPVRSLSNGAAAEFRPDRHRLRGVGRRWKMRRRPDEAKRPVAVF